MSILLQDRAALPLMVANQEKMQQILITMILGQLYQRQVEYSISYYRLLWPFYPFSYWNVVFKEYMQEIAICFHLFVYYNLQHPTFNYFLINQCILKKFKKYRIVVLICEKMYPIIEVKSVSHFGLHCYDWVYSQSITL